jgi:superfamily II DNA or RNA helicase
VLVAQVKHGKNIAALLPEAVLLTGQDSSDFRTTTLDQLRSGEQKIVIATTLADEGLDIPALEVLILAGAGKSETRALQRIGRALRKTKEKKEATIIDFYDKARFLEVHSRRRFEIYETERRFDIRMEDDFQDPSAGSKDLFEDIVRSPR